MTLSLIESSFTYRSESGGQSYYFTVVVNQNGVKSIRDIITPRGPLCGANTQVPQFVLDDQQLAFGQVGNLLAQTSAINGILTFLGQTSQVVSFGTPMVSTNYRVHVSPQDPVFFWVTNKTLTQFTVNSSVTFSGMVGFDVFV